MNPAVICHLDLDAFFASVEQRDRPDLRGKPVVVGADPKAGRGRGVVSTCSYEARTFGIHSAMPISQAYQRCPSAIFVPVDMKRYRDAADKVFSIMQDFTPDIEPVSIDEAFLDITGSFHLFGSPVKTAQLLKARIRSDVGLTASVGIAPVKMVAKIASDYSKPDGLLEILPGQVLGFLRPLPAERLWGVGPQTKNVLLQLGIRTIGNLEASGPDVLYERLGESGLHLFDLARGIDPRIVIASHDVKSVSHEYTFEEDTLDPAVLKRVLLELSEMVSRRLRKDGLKARTITLKLRTEGFKTYTRALTLPERTNYADVIYTTVLQLAKEFIPSGKKIRLLGVRSSNFDEAYVQESLFTPPGAVKKEQVYQAIDRIQDKFGDDAIHRAA